MKYVIWQTADGLWRARCVRQGQDARDVYASGESSVEALCNLLERLASRPAHSVA